MFTANQPSKVVIKTKDGKEFSEYLEYPKGDPREPMTNEDIENKFNALSSSLSNEEKQQNIKDVIFNCDEWKARDFMTELIV